MKLYATQFLVAPLTEIVKQFNSNKKYPEVAMLKNRENDRM